MPPHRWLALAVALAALPLATLAPSAHAGGVVPLTWRYAVSIPDPASGNVHVDVSLLGGKDAITHLAFTTVDHREPVTNVTGGPSTPLQQTADGIAFDVDGDESFSYDVMVERPAFNDATQRLAHVGTDFALFKAESLSLEFRYSYYEGFTFQNQTLVAITPPAGWQEAAPWPKLAEHEYALPDGLTLPRGYVAMGHFLDRVDRTVAGKDVHYVRLGKAASYEPQLFSFLENATTYYAAVYGPGVHRDVLVVNAPDPMFHGGLGGADSFFVHEDADIRTVAHEYAHVFQLFGTVETPPTSSIWLNEGDADYHSAIAMYAAGLWKTSDVNDFFATAANDQTDPTTAEARLPDAGYGTHLESFAYHKGLLVLRWLDDTIGKQSGGKLSLSDVLRALNARHGNESRPESAQPVTTDEVRGTVEAVSGVDVEAFFASDVNGSAWPLPYARFVPAGELAVDALVAQPTRASIGAPVAVLANVTNRGTQALKQELTLTVDGHPAARANVTLGVGEVASVPFAILANATPGDHALQLLTASTSYHSLAPANVKVARTTLSPAALHAKEAGSLLVLLKNDGEEPGTARVSASDENGTTLASTTETIVDGNATATLTLPLRFDEAGIVNLTLTLLTPRGNSTSALGLAVLAPEPPPTHDLIPGLSGKGTPSPAWLALAAAGIAVVLLRRR